MAKVELLICANDEADLASGHRRKKEGDIITAKPYPWSWGPGELYDHLIVIMETTTPWNQLRDLFEEREYTIQGNEDTTVLGKRAYQLPLANLKAKQTSWIDLTKVNDPNLIYQPFKSATQMVQKLDGVGKHLLLPKGEIDSVATGIGADDEFNITFGDNQIYSQYDSKYITVIP